MYTLILKSMTNGLFCLGNPLAADSHVEGIRHVAVTHIPKAVPAAEVVRLANRCGLYRVSAVRFDALRPGAIIRQGGSHEIR